MTAAKCKHCGYEWRTKSVRPYTTCPYCLYKVLMTNTVSSQAFAPTPAQTSAPAFTSSTDRGIKEYAALLRERLPELRRKYDVKFLGLFGSWVRREQTPKSDLDVLVEFDRAPSLFKFVELEEQLGRMLSVKVDLVMKSALKPHIGERILAEVVPV